MSAPVHLEPARFGLTGNGLVPRCHSIEFHIDAVSYSLDAPEYIARGSLQSTYVAVAEPYHYVCATDLRAGVLA